MPFSLDTMVNIIKIKPGKQYLQKTLFLKGLSPVSRLNKHNSN